MEILGQLSLRLEQDRMLFVFHEGIQSNAMGAIVFPKNCRQPFIGRDEF